MTKTRVLDAKGWIVAIVLALLIIGGAIRELHQHAWGDKCDLHWASSDANLDDYAMYCHDLPQR